jgi:lipopolysaccharide export system permease protein
MIYRSSITKELFVTSITTILILAGVVLAQRAVYIFRLASRGIIPNDTIETVLVFNLLKHMPLLLSLTIFLTILITLTRFYRDSEMIIWFSSGISLKKFILPILNFCLPIVCLIGFLSLFVSPWAVQKAEEYKSGLKNRDETSALMPGSFKESKSNNRVFYIEGLDDLGKKVKNIFVHSSGNKNISVIVSNEGERKINNNNTNYIVLTNGKKYESSKLTNELSLTKFREYGILIEQDTPRILKAGASIGMFEAITTIDLIKISLRDHNLRNKYLSEVLNRISQPISALILIFISIGMSHVNPRIGRSINIILALLFFIIYHNLMGVYQSLIGTGKVSLFLGFWPLHLVVLIFSIYLIRQRTNNKDLFKFIKKYDRKISK